jgi:hypothetical protein
MEILENAEAWHAAYREGWLAHLRKTGETKWDLYRHPRNQEIPGTAGVDLSRSRLMFISTAGGYLRETQQPFDTADPLGDYTLRAFPTSSPFDQLAYAHDHYDHARIDADPQVALPLVYLKELDERGRIGSLSPSVVSLMGYQPDSARAAREMAPQVVELARAEGAQAALLAPV